jgi:naphthoate synthase
MAFTALDLLSESPEGREGAAAFAENRAPDFRPHVKWH